MKISEVMTRAVKSCSIDDNLVIAVERMWHANCGILPVIDRDDAVVGVISDRDICLALGTRNELASELHVDEVFKKKLFSCAPDDSLQTALDIMGESRVRRLPVLDDKGKLVGIISLDDIGEISMSTGTRRKTVPPEKVVEVLRKVHPMRPEAAFEVVS